MRLVLASASPRRAELLAAAGYPFDILATDVDERVRPGEVPRDYVRRLAIEKSAAALEILSRPAKAGRHASHAGRHTSHTAGAEHETSDLIVLGADTAVIVDDEILGKPVDDGDSERMLRRLSGREHLVLTGVSLRSAGQQIDAVEETRVFFERLSDGQLRWYLGSGEGRDKAGAYAIQGLASRFIPRIEGSYSNVVGLPVALVSGLIGRFE